MMLLDTLQDPDLCIVLTSTRCQPQLLTVLTQTRGKIEVQLHDLRRTKKTFHPGTLLRFVPHSKKGNLFYTNDYEVLLYPEIATYQQLYLLHYSLELCHHFVAPEDLSHDIFNVLYRVLHLIYATKGEMKDLVHFLYTIYIVKLFSLVGFYPEKSYHVLFDFYDTIEKQSLDVMCDKNIPLLVSLHEKHKKGNTHSLALWILKCVQEHPLHQNFKVLNHTIFL